LLVSPTEHIRHQNSSNFLVIIDESELGDQYCDGLEVFVVSGFGFAFLQEFQQTINEGLLTLLAEEAHCAHKQVELLQNRSGGWVAQQFGKHLTNLVSVFSEGNTQKNA